MVAVIPKKGLPKHERGGMRLKAKLVPHHARRNVVRGAINDRLISRKGRLELRLRKSSRFFLNVVKIVQRAGAEPRRVPAETVW